MIRPALLLLLALSSPAWALSRPTFQPAPDARVDTSLVFAEASGARRPLGAILGGKPAILLIGYNKCPNLCGLTQNIVADALDRTGLKSDGYRAVFLSIDPGETPADAAAGKAKLARIMNRPDLPAWRFLTGTDDTIARLTQDLGYSYRRRQRIDEFVHPVSVAVLTPTGRLSRLLSSTTLKPRDLRLALVEASGEKIGTFSDQVVLLCAGFDFTKGQYTPLIGRILSVSGAATLALLGGSIFLLSWSRRG
ncbi:MAG: SCO family protein [Rhizobiaceae bacterium]|jgi:protein SCO1/2